MGPTVKRDFQFVGRVPCSKSLMNRALILQSFNPLFVLHGKSEAEDVHLMREALRCLTLSLPMECGSAGTVLRFMALRAARVPGVHILKGRPRLFERPQSELISLLGQLGCEATLHPDKLVITSKGWKPQGDMLNVNAKRSSQFMSAVLLSCWGLPMDLYLSFTQNMVSEAYFQMTYDLCTLAGLQCKRSGGEIMIPKAQEVAPIHYVVESDLDCAFALAACAVVAGSVALTGIPQKSLQPDSVFVNILIAMGVTLIPSNGQLKVFRTDQLKGGEWNLKSTPDLFPVLSVLCALARGPSRLSGATQLTFKESNRIQKTAELLKRIRPGIQATEDGMVFSDQPAFSPTEVAQFEFDPDQDHRMAMAAAVLLKAGYPVQIRHPEVVDKSFPEFWTCIQETEISF